VQCGRVGDSAQGPFQRYRSFQSQLRYSPSRRPRSRPESGIHTVRYVRKWLWPTGPGFFRVPDHPPAAEALHRVLHWPIDKILYSRSIASSYRCQWFPSSRSISRLLSLFELTLIPMTRVFLLNLVSGKILWQGPSHNRSRRGSVEWLRQVILMVWIRLPVPRRTFRSNSCHCALEKQRRGLSSLPMAHLNLRRCK